MKIKFIGTGNMSSVLYRNTQAIITTTDGSSMIFDAGADTKFNFSICKIPITILKGCAIYITHGHGDHIFGLEFLAFMSYFIPGIGRPKLIANHNVGKRLWPNALCMGLESLEDRQLKNGEKEATMTTYFDVKYVRDNENFEFGGTTFRPIQTIHIVSGAKFMDSYGLMFKTDNNKNVFISGDSQFSPSQLKGVLESADLIFHDCETSPYKSGVHAHYDELVLLPKPTKKKMLLEHHGDEVDDAFRQKALDDGFLGFVECGKEYII